ncbi:MAG: glycosyltransferase [Saprospiraceae bacterium]|nr:glycosyltransferase [Saprospiraceae bacterium]
MLLLIVSVFLAFVYLSLISAYFFAWKKISTMAIPDAWSPCDQITVLIPARNEAANIDACLDAIFSGNYPIRLFEVLVIDDFSTDTTELVVSAFAQKYQLPIERLRVISLHKELGPDFEYLPNKKRGIEIAVHQAQGAIIATTDADSVPPENWLKNIAYKFESEPSLQIVTGPVRCLSEGNLLSDFQSFDLLGTIGITAGGIALGWHQMGNGANLAYRKSAFEQVAGYSNNRQVASGDDMFLLSSIARRWPHGVGYIKTQEVVWTQAQSSWQSLLAQRLRWGGKNAAMPEWKIRLILLVVFVFCWSIWLNAAAALLLSGHAGLVVFQFLTKAMADFVLIRSVGFYFRQTVPISRFLGAFWVHTAYIPLLGLFSLVNLKPAWKGRGIA